MTFPALLALIVFIFCVGLLAYIYVGYPLIVIVLAKFFRRPVQKTDVLPTVTIVIPTFNEEVVIAEKIENTLHLDYPSIAFRLWCVTTHPRIAQLRL